MKALFSMAAVMVMAMTMVLSTGCETGPQAMDRQEPTLNLDVSRNTILAGETTTIFAQTANLLGRDVDIRWATTLGEVTPARSGRVAQFTSDQPGTAVVTAELNVEGQVLREQTNIVINPVN